MTYRSCISKSVLILALFLVVYSADALTIKKTSVKEMTDTSQLVVLGKVSDIRYVWEDASQRAINTLFTIEVEEYIKGSGDGTVVVRQLGGQIGDFGDHVSGAPQLNFGDEVVLFLQFHNGSWWIHSIALGVYAVVAQDDGQKYVLNDLRDINLVDEHSRKVDAAAAYTWMPVDEFIGQVREYVQQ
jgi:hypothetical protein